MAVFAKKAKRTEFELPPAGVPIDAELMEVQDLGEVSGKFGSKPRLMFRWETTLLDKKGNPIEVREYFTNTLHEKGNLAPRIFSVTGEMPDPYDERYNLESLVGAKAQMVVKYNTSEDGTTYANVVSLIRQPTRKEAASDARVQWVNDAKKKPQKQTGLSSRSATPRRRPDCR
jgi:hypothetical protein